MQPFRLGTKMRGVGRKRKTNKHLPQRVYEKHGAFHFVDKSGEWHRLAEDYSGALTALAKRLAADAPVDTIEQIIARYEAEVLGGKAIKTQRGRRQEFKKIRAVFGHMKAPDIKPHHVWDYWRRRGETVQARHEIRALSTVLTYARRIGALHTENPCFGLRLPDAGPRTRYVPDGEYASVRGVAQPMVAYAMDLALQAGMDSATVRSLRWSNAKPEGLEFVRPKTQEFQLIEWNEDLRATWKALRAERPQLRQAVICNRRGQPYTADGFQAQWQRTMRKAKKLGLTTGFHFHDLRAKSASDGGSDQEAADRLGHGDVKLTRKVYRRLPRRGVALRILDKRHEY
jgi:integrase